MWQQAVMWYGEPITRRVHRCATIAVCSLDSAACYVKRIPCLNLDFFLFVGTLRWLQLAKMIFGIFFYEFWIALIQFCKSLLRYVQRFLHESDLMLARELRSHVSSCRKPPYNNNDLRKVSGMRAIRSNNTEQLFFFAMSLLRSVIS